MNLEFGIRYPGAAHRKPKSMMSGNEGVPECRAISAAVVQAPGVHRRSSLCSTHALDGRSNHGGRVVSGSDRNTGACAGAGACAGVCCCFATCAVMCAVL